MLLHHTTATSCSSKQAMPAARLLETSQFPFLSVPRPSTHSCLSASIVFGPAAPQGISSQQSHPASACLPCLLGGEAAREARKGKHHQGDG